MPQSEARRRLRGPLATGLWAGVLALGCGDSASIADAGLQDAGSEATVDGSVEAAVCEVDGLEARPFSEGPYGLHRGDLAEDFTVPLTDGSEWNLRDRWSGCDSYVLIPDTRPVSQLDPTSIWESDLDALVARSPRNAHYFFGSFLTNATLAAAAVEAMTNRIETLLGTLDPEDAAHWRERLHVVEGQSRQMDNWLADVFITHGRLGFAVDRLQKIRGLGSLADVNRFSPALEAAGAWPYEANLAYAAHAPRHYNQQARLAHHLENDGATVIPIFERELSPPDAEVELPSATELAKYDTMEVEITLECENPTIAEFGNCPAWDTGATLQIEDDGDFIELARTITSYHRESHWLVDVTPMMVHIAAGGTRTFRWSNGGNVTSVSLRLSNRGKGYRPAEATFLWGGGGFNAGYNAGKTPIDVPIPADAARVEVYAVITGHGFGSTVSNCAEFCDHHHEFTVSGTRYVEDHPPVGNNEGCLEQIEDGTGPNQWGTWWFGRGGWCPGMQVEPWIVDVTGDVTPGETATVSYRAILHGNEPPDNAGSIWMDSYLVVYR